MSGFEMQLYDVDETDEVRPARAKAASNRAAHYAVADIAGGAGWLGVDRSGALVEVEFDEQVVRAMRPEHLGGYLVAALQKAEDLASRQRKESLRGRRR